MKFCAIIFTVYLVICADSGKRKKVCEQRMSKVSDLEDLIIKKQDFYNG